MALLSRRQPAQAARSTALPPHRDTAMCCCMAVSLHIGRLDFAAYTCCLRGQQIMREHVHAVLSTSHDLTSISKPVS